MNWLGSFAFGFALAAWVAMIADRLIVTWVRRHPRRETGVRLVCGTRQHWWVRVDDHRLGEHHWRVAYCRNCRTEQWTTDSTTPLMSEDRA